MEMLGLDMDIESELGIDSIKRVEILSTLEEKMPGNPVDPGGKNARSAHRIT
ncbi:MAG: hypothetical protein JRF47_01270 [Deltaproteobacteria bacterium]|nr:hypothetical protein [Deltaproteobacteria bacterium]